MIILNVCERQATALVKGRVTTDSVGLPVEVNLSPEYDGLPVWVCFRAGETAADVALMDGTEVEVPSQCLQVAGEALQVGVWAGDGDGNVRIPTVWASAGTIKQGTERSGIDPAEPAPDWAAQVQQWAEDAHDTAERLAAEVDGWETEIDAAVQGAETAAAAALAAASSASSAATSATNAASAASTAAGQASTAAGAATDAASEATGAAASATAAAAAATEAAGMADNATAAATAAASNAGTATREAIAATTGANTAAATANAAAGSASTAASSATTAAGTATDAAASATSAASAAGTAASAASTAATAANAAAEAATEAAEGIAEAYFPGLAAGSADGITGGGPLVEGAFVERTCPGTDGPARVESIHGKTVVWNQLVSVRNKSVPSAERSSYGNAYIQLSNQISIMAGHVYFGKAKFTLLGDATTATIYLTGTASQGSMASSTRPDGSIFTASANLSAPLGIRVTAASYPATFGCDATDIQLIDLTQMFGAGNEPSTVAEFESMFPEPYYPYDAGSLLPVHVTGVESVGDGWTFERTIPAATYFPNGMRSAGSVYDELTSTQAVTRVGSRAHQSGDEDDASVVTDGTITYYALATPTTTTFDSPLNLTYKAAQGGTERVMHDEPTAPPTLVVQYGSTADGIRDRALAAIADPDGPVAQSNHAIGTYLTMGGTLYKVTRAIAVGETIAAGTNVTATTVMAEILSLIQ